MAGRKWTDEEKQAARDRLAKMRAEGKLKRKPKTVKVKDIHVPSPTSVEEPEDLVQITMNLAPSAEAITINGQAYWHGKTYKVPLALARDLNAAMGNTWKHEAQIHGESENQYRRPTHRRLRPQ